MADKPKKRLSDFFKLKYTPKGPSKSYPDRYESEGIVPTDPAQRERVYSKALLKGKIRERLNLPDDLPDENITESNFSTPEKGKATIEKTHVISKDGGLIPKSYLNDIRKNFGIEYTDQDFAKMDKNQISKFITDMNKNIALQNKGKEASREAEVDKYSEQAKGLVGMFKKNLVKPDFFNKATEDLKGNMPLNLSEQEKEDSSEDADPLMDVLTNKKSVTKRFEVIKELTGIPFLFRSLKESLKTATPEKFDTKAFKELPDYKQRSEYFKQLSEFADKPEGTTMQKLAKLPIAVGQTFSSVLKGTETATMDIASSLMNKPISVETLNEMPLHALGGVIDKLIKEYDPDIKRDFITDLSQGMGSMVGFLGTGKVISIFSKLSPILGTTYAGAFANGQPAFEETYNKTGDIGKAFDSFWFNSLIGTTEALPIADLLNRINKVSSGSVTKAIMKDAGIQFGEEFLQEGGQQLAGSLYAKYGTGEDMDKALSQIFEESLYSAIQGGVTGALTGGVGSTVGQIAQKQSENKQKINDVITGVLYKNDESSPEVNKTVSLLTEDIKNLQAEIEQSEDPAERLKLINQLEKTQNKIEELNNEKQKTSTNTDDVKLPSGKTTKGKSKEGSGKELANNKTSETVNEDDKKGHGLLRGLNQQVEVIDKKISKLNEDYKTADKETKAKINKLRKTLKDEKEKILSKESSKKVEKPAENPVVKPETVNKPSKESELQQAEVKTEVQPEAKPYEQTQRDYIENNLKGIGEQRKGNIVLLKALHKKSVYKAIEEGQTVSKEVLKAYPGTDDIRNIAIYNLVQKGEKQITTEKISEEVKRINPFPTKQEAHEMTFDEFEKAVDTMPINKIPIKAFDNYETFDGHIIKVENGGKSVSTYPKDKPHLVNQLTVDKNTETSYDQIDRFLKRHGEDTSSYDYKYKIKKAITRQALSEGRAVPENVLKDYPDLRNKKPVSSPKSSQTEKPVVDYFNKKKAEYETVPREIVDMHMRRGNLMFTQNALEKQMGSKGLQGKNKLEYDKVVSELRDIESKLYEYEQSSGIKLPEKEMPKQSAEDVAKINAEKKRLANIEADRKKAERIKAGRPDPTEVQTKPVAEKEVKVSVEGESQKKSENEIKKWTEIIDKDEVKGTERLRSYIGSLTLGREFGEKAEAMYERKGLSDFHKWAMEKISKKGELKTGEDVPMVTVKNADGVKVKKPVENIDEFAELVKKLSTSGLTKMAESNEDEAKLKLINEELKSRKKENKVIKNKKPKTQEEKAQVFYDEVIQYRDWINGTKKSNLSDMASKRKWIYALKNAADRYNAIHPDNTIKVEKGGSGKYRVYLNGKPLRNISGTRRVFNPDEALENIENTNATTPFSELGENEKFYQQSIALVFQPAPDTFLESVKRMSDIVIPTGKFKKGIKDIIENAGKEQSAEGQLTRDALIDIYESERFDVYKEFNGVNNPEVTALLHQEYLTTIPPDDILYSEELSKELLDENQEDISNFFKEKGKELENVSNKEEVRGDVSKEGLGGKARKDAIRPVTDEKNLGEKSGGIRERKPEERLGLTKKDVDTATKKYGITFTHKGKDDYTNIITEERYSFSTDSEFESKHFFTSGFIGTSRVDQTKPFAVLYFGDNRGLRYEYATASNDINESLDVLKNYDNQEGIAEIYNPTTKEIESFVIYPNETYTNESVGLQKREGKSKSSKVEVFKFDEQSIQEELDDVDDMLKDFGAKEGPSFQKADQSPGKLDKATGIVAKLIGAGYYRIEDIANHIHDKGADAMLPYLKEAYSKYKNEYNYSIAIKNSLDNEQTIEQFDHRKDRTGRTQEQTKIEEERIIRGHSDYHAIRGNRYDKRPALRYSDEENLPAYSREYVVSEKYGTELDEHQRYAVNLILNAFADGKKAFLLGDGTGVGKTRELLATAEAYREHINSEKPILIVTANKTIIEQRFKGDAETLGIKPDQYAFATYDDVQRGELSKNNYGLVLFDEAHKLKNALSKRSLEARKLKYDNIVYATATPMDRIVSAVYFLSQITGVPKQEMYNMLEVHETTAFMGGENVLIAVLNDGTTIDHVVKNLITLRNRAIENGTMLRREYPFYGKMEVMNVPKNENYRAGESYIVNYWQEKMQKLRFVPSKDMSDERKKELRKMYGQKRRSELLHITELTKIKPIVESALKDLADGRQVVVMLDRVNGTEIESFLDSGGQFNHKLPGPAERYIQLFKEAGYEVSSLFGTGKHKIEGINKFQSGENKVLLGSYKSAAEGVDLDDVVGNAPRVMYDGMPSESGDLFQQVPGRVSRRNTKSPALVKMVFVEGGINDDRRRVINAEKIRTLHAIQEGKDSDAQSIIEGYDSSGESQTPDISFQKANRIIVGNIGDLTVKLKSLETRKEKVLQQIEEVKKLGKGDTVISKEEESFQPDFFGQAEEQAGIGFTTVRDSNKVRLQKFNNELAIIDREIIATKGDISTLNKRAEQPTQEALFQKNNKDHISSFVDRLNDVIEATHKVEKSFPGIEIVYVDNENVIDILNEMHPGQDYQKGVDEPKAFVDRKTDKVYINLDMADASSPAHEIAGHVFMKMLKTTNPAMYRTGLKIALQDEALVEKVQDEYDLQGDAFNDEVLAQAVGMKFEDLFQKMKPAERQTWIDRFKSWFKGVIDNIKLRAKAYFKGKPEIIREIDKLTIDSSLDEWTTAIATDILNERVVDYVSSDELRRESGLKFQYAGKNAKGYRDAKSEGKVFKNPYDRKERFEIDDSKARVKENFWTFIEKQFEEHTKKQMKLLMDNRGKSITMLAKEGNEEAIELLEASDRLIARKFKLSEVIDHPELFKNYPGLKYYNVVFSTNNLMGDASFNPQTKEIKVSNKALDQKYLLLHEIQHAIQQIEGFAKGGNVEMFKIANANAEAFIKEIDKILLSKIGTSKNKQLESYVWDYTGKKITWEELLNKAYELIPEDVRMEVLSRQRESSQIGDVFEKYRKLAGEIEARDVQARMNLTKEQRDPNSPEYVAPYSSENISPEDAIVYYGESSDPRGLPSFQKEGVDFEKSNMDFDGKNMKKPFQKILEGYRINPKIIEKETSYKNIKIGQEIPITPTAKYSGQFENWTEERTGTHTTSKPEFMLHMSNYPLKEFSGKVESAFYPEELAKDYLQEALINKDVPDALDISRNILDDKTQGGIYEDYMYLVEIPKGRKLDNYGDVEYRTRLNPKTDKITYLGKRDGFKLKDEGDKTRNIYYANNDIVKTYLNHEPDSPSFQKADKQTDTKAFKAWFGDSKVVDEQGKPLVVYHSTDSDFTVFDLSKRGEKTRAANTIQGIFFTDNLEQSQRFGKRTISAYIKIEKPLDITIKGLYSNKQQAADLVTMMTSAGVDLKGEDALAWIDENVGLGEIQELYDAFNQEDWLEDLKSLGYDGIISDFDNEGTLEWIVFEPTQIKSTGNTGEFNPNNPDIRFQKATKDELKKGNTLYEALLTKDTYKIDELSDDTLKSKKEVALALNDLVKRRLVEKTAKGEYKPTDELKILLDDIQKHPAHYDLTYDKLYSNPIQMILDIPQKLDDLWQKLIGDKIYKALGSVISKITPEAIKRGLVTNYGLPKFYIESKREALIQIEQYKQLSKELAESLKYKNIETKEEFSRAEQRRLTQIIKGGVTTNPLLRQRADQVIEEIKKLEALGKQLEVLPVETYNTKLSRKRIAELLKEKSLLEKKLDKFTVGDRSVKEMFDTYTAKIDELKAQKEDLKKQLKDAKDKDSLKNQIREINDSLQDVTEKLKSVTPTYNKYQRPIDAIDSKIKNHYLHGGEGYFKRVYLTKEQEKTFKKYGYARPTRLDLTSAIHRTDIPIEVRIKMGEVLTASFPVAKSVLLEGKDVSLGRFFEVIAEHPDYADTVERPGWVKLPDNKKLGKLKNMWVPKEIADDLNDVIKFTDEKYAEKFLKQITSIWKASKVIMNPATQVRNVITNTVMLDYSGTSHVTQATLLPEAIKSIRGTGKYSKELKISGLRSSTFNSAELNKFLDVVSDMDDKPSFAGMNLGEKIAYVYGKVSLVDTKIGEKAGDLYQFSELLFKTVKFIDERQKGKSIQEARDQANKWLFDYGEIPQWVRTARESLFGVPFATWMFKAIPRVIEASITRPITFWKYIAIFSAITAYALKAMDIDDDDWENIRTQLPERLKNGQFILIPWRDENGNMQLFDVSFIMPYQNVYSLLNTAYTLAAEGETPSGDTVVEGVLQLISNPITTAFRELSTNKIMFTDRPIWNLSDTPIEKTQKILDYTYKLWMPPIASEIPGVTRGGYAYDKLRSAISQRPDYYGRTMSFAPAFTSSILGLKTNPIEVSRFINTKINEQEAILQDLSENKGKMMKDNSLTSEERLELGSELDDRMTEIKNEIRLLNRQLDPVSVEGRILARTVRSLQKAATDEGDPLKKKQLLDKVNAMKLDLDRLQDEKFNNGKDEGLAEIKGNIRESINYKDELKILRQQITAAVTKDDMDKLNDLEKAFDDLSSFKTAPKEFKSTNIKKEIQMTRQKVAINSVFKDAGLDYDYKPNDEEKESGKIDYDRLYDLIDGMIDKTEDSETLSDREKSLRVKQFKLSRERIKKSKKNKAAGK